METSGHVGHREPWNKGKIVGQKTLIKLKDIWALRVRLQMEGGVRSRRGGRKRGIDRGRGPAAARAIVTTSRRA